MSGSGTNIVGSIPAGECTFVLTSRGFAAQCDQTVSRMADFVAKILHPDGEIPLLGDSCVGEVAMPHASDVATAAAKLSLKGPYRHWFWGGGIVVGNIIPLVFGIFGSSPTTMMSVTLAALLGIFILEYIFVMAPQKIPNS